MANQLTIQQIINIAKISEYLAANDISRGVLFGARKIPTSSRILYMEWKAVQWMYDLDPTDDSLRLTANYLFSICRGYNLQAQAISGGSGGSVSPVNPGTPPSPIEFTVADSGTPFVDGQSTLLLTSFIGFNMIFNRDNTPQTQVDTGGMYFTWSRTTGLMTIVGPAITGELFSINAV